MTAKKKELVELMIDNAITPSDFANYKSVSSGVDSSGNKGFFFYNFSVPRNDLGVWSSNWMMHISCSETCLNSKRTFVTKDQFIAAYNERNKQKEWPTESDIDAVAQNGEVEEVTINKYSKEIKPGVFVDVYDVLKAWNVTNPALQHLIKKALQPGARGHKTLEQDIDDIIASAKRAKEML